MSSPSQPPSDTEVLVQQPQQPRIRMAKYMLSLTFVAGGPVRERQITAMFNGPLFIGEVISVHTEAVDPCTTTAAVMLTTFAAVGRAKQHIAEHLERAPGAVLRAELIASSGNRIPVYCPRRSDGCTKMGGHRDDCFTGQYLLVYLMSVSIDPAGTQVDPDQIRDLMAPYLATCDGELRDAYTNYRDGAHVIAVFTGHEDPQICREQMTALLAQFPVPILAADLLYEVPDLCETTVDLLTS